MPICLGALVWWRDSHYLKASSKLFSLQKTAGWPLPCHVCTSGVFSTGIVCNQGQNGHSNNSRKQVIASKFLASYIHLHVRTPSPMPLGSVKNHCLFPSSTSPVIAAKTQMSCCLSEHWCAAGSFLCLKGVPKLSSAEEGSCLSGEDFIFIIGTCQHITSRTPGPNGHFKNFTNKSLEASLL